MTMLDRMRRHKGWLKWSLALVVLTFVVFYIPDFLTTGIGAAPSEVSRKWKASRSRSGNSPPLQRAGHRVSQRLRRPDQRSADQAAGIDRQILTQLVDEEAMVAESRKQGFTVSDVEIRERILAAARVPGERQIHWRAELSRSCCRSRIRR